MKNMSRSVQAGVTESKGDDFLLKIFLPPRGQPSCYSFLSSLQFYSLNSLAVCSLLHCQPQHEHMSD
uniref:Uncharacterized protein n=1 Tax=Aegilops tauschii subsp. strangulata TaxID=200361 RepID=A0A453H497_AEGTS